MELVFMRHGKAEPRSDAKSDFERELTSMGRKKMKQAAQGLARCLFHGRDVLIWTGPSVRTMQTAEILQTALGRKTKLQTVDAIADGILADLQTEWSKITAPDVLIIVGHEPMLSEWTKKISDAAIVFRPGSAASIMIDSPGKPVGSIAWFMRAGIMARLGLFSCSQRRQRP